jgi:hypothetical protein
MNKEGDGIRLAMINRYPTCRLYSRDGPDTGARKTFFGLVEDRSQGVLLALTGSDESTAESVVEHGEPARGEADLSRRVAARKWVRRGKGKKPGRLHVRVLTSR